MRWPRRRSPVLVLRAVQLRVVPADGADGPAAEPAPEPKPPKPEAVTVSAAPPLAVRPVEDPQWMMRN